MRISFLTGSITRIGSGRTEAIPLANAFSKMGCPVYGLEIRRFKRGRSMVEGLEVHFEPLAPYLALHSLKNMPALWKKSSPPSHLGGLNGGQLYDCAVGEALLNLGNRLKVDVVYAFHNANVARVLKGWPHPSRLLVINLVGFGIDPSRGGATDTFPLQKRIFQHPYWDLHIAATKFEFDQYWQVYDQLGIDPKKLIHLPHSYDEEFFRPPMVASVNRSSGNDKDLKIILYPVNVYPRKNIELAIDVLSRLNRKVDCKLIVTGRIWDRTYYASLRQRAADQGVGDKVEFLGGMPIEKLLQLYQQADVTVYTSHQETFGLGIVESLACDTPVVGPDWIAPCREILSESPGGWTMPNDPDKFAAGILAAFKSGYEPGRLASYARDHYGNMTIAARFLEKCREIKTKKDAYRERLRSVYWKGLYQDAGDLL